MENVKISIEGNRLSIEIDLEHQGSFTRQFKSRRIATTGGNLHLWRDGEPLPDNTRLNLNLVRSLREDERQEAEQMRANTWR